MSSVNWGQLFEDMWIMVLVGCGMWISWLILDECNGAPASFWLFSLFCPLMWLVFALAFGGPFMLLLGVIGIYDEHIKQKDA